MKKCLPVGLLLSFSWNNIYWYYLKTKLSKVVVPILFSVMKNIMKDFHKPLSFEIEKFPDGISEKHIQTTKKYQICSEWKIMNWFDDVSCNIFTFIINNTEIILCPWIILICCERINQFIIIHKKKKKKKKKKKNKKKFYLHHFYIKDINKICTGKTLGE